jgi:Ser/Thr protein kinase RdoA (MazF antagonist)
LGLGPDLEALVRGYPATLVRAERISRHGAARETRDTFRLEFAEGVTLKGRRVRSPAIAERVAEIVKTLDPGRFPRVVGCRGMALLEEWIPGTTIEGMPSSPERLRWAAETLAGVHRLPPPRPRAPRWLAARKALIWQHLRRLADRGVLSRADATSLRDLAYADAPEQVGFSLIHRDLCPENIVLDPRGRLFCIDNAAARGGSPDEDLARTFYRWPLDGRDADLFLDAYGRFRDPRGFLAHRRFWMIAALSHATWIRHARGYARPDVPLRRLHAQLEGAPPDSEPHTPCSASPTAPS